MAIFVNYEGPELAKEQKQTVRSHVMVLVRGRQKQAKKGQIRQAQSRPPTGSGNNDDARGVISTYSNRAAINLFIPSIATAAVTCDPRL